ncbi:RNA-directed DNA polymerase from mobile element jockey-like protein, partial [Leptotrombidium deliense]
MNELNYFSDYQFAFPENFSTQCMCLSLQHDICKSLDQKKYSVMVSIDLRKAFDTVNRQLLLDKLHCLGITGTAFKWFQSYFQSRTQFVKVNS